MAFIIKRTTSLNITKSATFFRRNTHLTPFYFYNHGLQRIWLFLSFSIQRIRCPWLNVLFTMSMMLGIGYSPMQRIENSMAEMR